MFMSMNRILCQKPGFCVKKRFIEKVDLLKKSTFFERGIFERKFLGKMRNCQRIFVK